MVRDVIPSSTSNNRDKTNEKVVGLLGKVSDSKYCKVVKEQAPVKAKNNKLPLKDITKMILNNITNSKDRVISHLPSKVTEQHAYGINNKDNQEVSAPYGNPCVPQVRVQPK